MTSVNGSPLSYYTPPHSNMSAGEEQNQPPTQGDNNPGVASAPAAATDCDDDLAVFNASVTRSATHGRRQRAANYTQDEVMHLLRILEDVVHVSTFEWKSLLDSYSE